MGRMHTTTREGMADMLRSPCTTPIPLMVHHTTRRLRVPPTHRGSVLVPICGRAGNVGPGGTGIGENGIQFDRNGNGAPGMLHSQSQQGSLMMSHPNHQNHQLIMNQYESGNPRNNQSPGYYRNTDFKDDSSQADSSFGGSVLQYQDPRHPGRGTSTGTSSNGEKRSSSESNRGSDEGSAGGMIVRHYGGGSGHDPHGSKQNGQQTRGRQGNGGNHHNAHHHVHHHPNRSITTRTRPMERIRDIESTGTR